MQTREFRSREEAIGEAAKNGYSLLHDPRGRVILSNGEREYALVSEQRARIRAYHLMNLAEADALDSQAPMNIRRPEVAI